MSVRFVRAAIIQTIVMKATPFEAAFCYDELLFVCHEWRLAAIKLVLAIKCSWSLCSFTVFNPRSAHLLFVLEDVATELLRRERPLANDRRWSCLFWCQVSAPDTSGVVVLAYRLFRILVRLLDVFLLVVLWRLRVSD